MNGRPQLRPLRFVEVIDVAARLVRRDFVALAMVIAALVAWLALLEPLVSYVTADEVAMVDGRLTYVFADEADLDRANIVSGGLGLLQTLGTVAALGGLTYIVGRRHGNGAPTAWGDAVRFGLGRLGSLLWIGVLIVVAVGVATAVALLLAFVLAAVAGVGGAVIGVVGILALTVYLYTRLILAFPAFVEERIRGLRALQRSWHLMRGRWWTTFGTLVVAVVIVVAVQVGVGVAAVGALQLDSIPLVVGLVTLLELGTLFLVLPFFVATLVVTYYDLRVRREGLDLERLTGELPAPAVEPVPSGTAVAWQAPLHLEDELPGAGIGRSPLAGKETKILAVVMIALTSIAIFGVMQPQWIFTANTPTGGDMGAHVYLPAYVRDSLLPEGRILGWSNDWYAGFPVLYFYFPLPTLTIVALDVILPYGVAFKLVTIAGLVALPAAAYFLVRKLGFSRPVATVAGVSGATFVFMESHTIFGGNIAATLAGEFSFSWGLALSLVYLGLVAEAAREERGFTPAAAVVLALAALSHVVTTLVIVLATLPLLARLRGWKPVMGAWTVGFAIAGFWAVPLLARVRGFTADMNWNPVEGWDKVLPREFLPVALLGIVGLAWAALRRYHVGPLFFMAWIPVAGYFLLDAHELTKLYNARLLPFWYLSMFIAAGIGVGLAVVELARRAQVTGSVLVLATATAAVFFLAVGAAGLSFAPGWARWNFKGYEGKDAWPEYQALVEKLDGLPPGRVMWEANSDLNKYGTPMALMLLPYWTEGDNPSMEGLYFESAISTPFHFLNAAEVSQRPSNPIRGLDYHTFEFERSLAHLPLYDVDYYVAFTDEAKAKADELLTRVLTSEPFAVYTSPEASLVEVATTVPGVYEGPGSFEEVARTWYDDIERLDQWLVREGPDEWPRVTDPEAPYPVRARPVATGGAVSDIVLENHRIAFRTTAVGVPHLVKVSHFPNWQASGAEGPYRAAPSLMVVVPTEEEVELRFGYTWAEYLGYALTVTGVVGLGVYAWRRRRTSGSRAG